LGDFNYKDLQISLWLKRNSIKNNEDYFIKLFDHFGIKESNYHFINDGFGDYSVIIKLGISYLIQINSELMCYNLLFEAKATKNVKYISKKDKNNARIRFFGENVMYEALEEIMNIEEKRIKR